MMPKIMPRMAKMMRTMMINNARYTPLIVFLIVLASTLAATGSIDDQAREVAGELLCPVCQGQSVSESNSDLAEDMKKIIKAKLEAGESKQQILDYFVARYGESILGAPSPRGLSLFLWILPGILLVAGAAMIFIFIRKGDSERTDAADQPVPAKGTGLEERLARELESFDK